MFLYCFLYFFYDWVGSGSWDRLPPLLCGCATTPRSKIEGIVSTRTTHARAEKNEKENSFGREKNEKENSF